MPAEGQSMTVSNPKTHDLGGPVKAEKAATAPIATRVGDDCRCKAASEMSPGELLKLMVSDLAFWKKPKKE
jgi:hypothetical protein